MPASSVPSEPQADRWALLWLFLGAFFTLLGRGRWSVPLAALLGPLFLVRFLRRERPWRGFLLYMVVVGAAAGVAWYGMVPYSPQFFFVFMVVMLVTSYLPYLWDRLLVPRIMGFAATLIFPLAWTTKEYLSSLFSPMSGFASVAYSQYGNLPLMQVLAVTGLWGITFLVIWFGSVMNWAWENHWEWQRIRVGAAGFAGVLSAVLLGGEIRLALFPPQGNAVRVATLTAQDRRASRLPQDRASFRELSAKILDDYLAATQQQARAGARIVSWPEVAVPLEREDEAAYIGRGREVAQRAGIYLLLAFWAHRSPGPWGENKVVLIDPTGTVLWEYIKARPVPGDPDIAGDGQLRIAETPYGRVAAAICYDLDFPGLMRQAGRNRVDLLFGPSLEWREIKNIHAAMAVFRAVENGVSLVRAASNGISLAVDYQGRVLASMDHFTAEERVLVAQVPTRGVATIYSRVGDLFAWLAVAGFVGFFAVGIRRGRAR